MFLNCYESSCVSPKGWNNWGNVDNEETAFYAEYKCYGPGSDTSKRVDWSRQLTDVQAAQYTMANIYAAASNRSVSTDWLPQAESDLLCLAEQKHTFKFPDPVNVSAALSSLIATGEDVEGFHPDSTLIPVELPAGTTEVPELEATSNNEATTIQINYPEEIPGFAHIDVLTPYLAKTASYDICFSVDSSFHSANILSVTMKGEPIPDFDPEVTGYDFTVPPGSSKYFAIDAELEAKLANFTYERPASLPGLYKLSVTAVDGYTKKDYYVYVSFATSVQPSDAEPFIRMENPVGNRINGHLNVRKAGGYTFFLFSSDGRLLLEHPLGKLPVGENDFSIGTDQMEQGSYVFRISGPGAEYKGQLVK